MTKDDILSYAYKFGNEQAIDFLLLIGPDGFKGTYDEYNSLMDLLRNLI